MKFYILYARFARWNISCLESHKILAIVIASEQRERGNQRTWNPDTLDYFAHTRNDTTEARFAHTS